MEPIRAGILGFGRVAEAGHLPVLQSSERYDVVGVCDITPARRAAAEAAGLRTTDSLDEFLGWDVELVTITTHSSAHHENALRCARAGKHMVIEKPLAVTSQEAEEMAAAAADNGVVLTVRHNRRFDEDYRLVKSAVRAGLVGDLLTVENRTIGSAPAVGYGSPDFNPDWRITAGQGGGTLLDFGPHWIDQVLDLMEGHRVVQVWGDVRNVRWGSADDMFRIEMLFDNGVRGVASKIDVAYYCPTPKWFVLGTEATLHGAEGERGEMHVTVSGPESRVQRMDKVPSVDLYANLVAHLRDGQPLLITTEHALRVMRVLQAGVDSSKAGKSIDVNI